MDGCVCVLEEGAVSRETAVFAARISETDASRYLLGSCVRCVATYDILLSCYFTAVCTRLDEAFDLTNQSICLKQSLHLAEVSREAGSEVDRTNLYTAIASRAARHKKSDFCAEVKLLAARVFTSYKDC